MRGREFSPYLERCHNGGRMLQNGGESAASAPFGTIADVGCPGDAGRRVRQPLLRSSHGFAMTADRKPPTSAERICIVQWRFIDGRDVPSKNPSRPLCCIPGSTFRKRVNAVVKATKEALMPMDCTCSLHRQDDHIGLHRNLDQWVVLFRLNSVGAGMVHLVFFIQQQLFPN